MTTTTRPALTAIQAGIADHARAALDKPHGHEMHDLAVRIGVLEFHLGEALALVDQLASQDG